MGQSRRSVEYCIRLGMGIMYLYSGVELLRDPTVWEFFIPDWLYTQLETMHAVPWFLRLQGIGELVLAIAFLAWFLPKSLVRIAALAAAFEMLVIVVSLGVDTATFRDIGLLGSLLALFVLLQKPKEHMTD